METNRWRRLLFIFIGGGVLIGGIFFLFIYGPKVLLFTNDSWLLNNTDLNQHYIGWKFYRNSSWNFPIGLINGLTARPISIIYTDSIPIFAIIFKIASPILPTTFQYFGLWGLLCFILQATFALTILAKYTSKKLDLVLGASFFTFSAIIIQRLFVHTALASNWIILAAFTIFVYHESFKGKIKKNIIAWTVLMCLSVTIHMYYAPMVFAIMCSYFLYGYLMERSSRNARIILSTISISTVSALLFMYLLGAFYGKSNIVQIGFGIFSSNLNTFVNAQGNSFFLKSLPLASAGQGEGYGYLGVGVILLLFLAIAGYFNKTIKKPNRNLIISIALPSIILSLFSLSSNITLGSKTLLKIPLPSLIYNLFSIFRASGRFIWPVYYLLILISVVLVVLSYKKRIASVILTCCLAIQIVDLQPAVQYDHVKYTSAASPSMLASKAWREIGQNFNKIEFITKFTAGTSYDNKILSDYFTTKEIFDLGNYAVDNKLSMNDFYIGRRDGKYIENEEMTQWKQLLKGEVNDKTLYIFPQIPYILIDNPYINLYICDNIIIGISSKYKWKNEPKKRISWNNPINVLHYKKYVNKGKINNDEIVLYNNGIIYGPYIPLKKGTYQVNIDGENLSNSYLDVYSNQYGKKLPLFEMAITPSLITYKFKAPIDIFDVELRIVNTKKDEIKVMKIDLQKID